MRRPLPSHPGHEIDHDGTVWSVSGKKATKLPHGANTNRLGTVHLTVKIGGREHLIWPLLGRVIHEGGLILPRDGNFLNLRLENTVALRLISSDKITDPDEIHLIWRLYCSGVTCALMAGVSGLIGYWDEDFRNLIKDVLWAGIR